MKRTILVVLTCSLLLGVAPSPTLDPSPGTFIGQKTFITNPLQEAITVSGTTQIKLNSPVTLAVGQQLALIWDGTYWVGLDFRPGKASFDYIFSSVAVGTCKSTLGHTVVGAVLGDGCVAGAVVNPAEDVELNCRITADGVGTLFVCANTPLDGGTGGFSINDAGFTIRAIK